MKGPLKLIAHSLKRVRTLLLIIGILLATFQIFIILTAKAFDRSKALENLGNSLPQFVRDFLGPATSAFLSFGGMVAQGYFHPIVMVSAVALTIVISTIPTAEIESGFMDLVMSRPIARHWIITRSLVVMLISTIALLAMMLAGTWLGFTLFVPPDLVAPSSTFFLSLAINLGFLMLCWSGLTIAIAAASRRRSVAATIIGLTALVTFLLDYVARAWHPAQAIAWISPFHYYDGLKLIIGVPLELEHLVVLTIVAVAGYISAYIVFLQRDLSK